MVSKRRSCKRSPTFEERSPRPRSHSRRGAMIPNGLKYHFEAEEGVLKAIGTAAAAAQQQKMEAQQQQTRSPTCATARGNSLGHGCTGRLACGDTADVTRAHVWRR